MMTLPTSSVVAEDAAPSESISALLIDDDDVDRERLRRMLQRIYDNIHICEAATKKDALSLLHSASDAFTFIFLDFKLNDGDGRELLPEIQRTLGNDCCVVAITGSGNEQSAANAIKLGIHDYLSKEMLSAEALAIALAEGLRLLKHNKLLHEAEKKILHRSLHDPLTDLPNRHLFFDRLDQLCATHRRDETYCFAVMMMDLDRFKLINDRYGHAAGDQVLIEAAHRLRNTLREVDTVARLGGDEFAALLPSMHTIEDVQALGSKLLAALGKPISIGNELVDIGGSIGFALCPMHGDQTSTLTKHADSAMYRAKNGMNKVCIHDPNFANQNGAAAKDKMLRRIKKSLENGEIQWHWQPKLNLANNVLASFELLARWGSSQRENINTTSLIEAIEDTSIILDFTLATLKSALFHADALGDVLQALPIAINISAKVLEQQSFVEELIGIIEASNIPCKQIVFELTETSLISNPVQAQKVVELLSAHGISLSIDDFGAGFTSFSYLRDFHVAEIKIDKSYVLDISNSEFNQSLVRSLVVFCNSLGIRLVAEGVENKQCRDILLQCGCIYGQGFGLAMPMPPESVRDWIAAHTRDRLNH